MVVVVVMIMGSNGSMGSTGSTGARGSGPETGAGNEGRAGSNGRGAGGGGGTTRGGSATVTHPTGACLLNRCLTGNESMRYLPPVGFTL